MIIIIIIIIVIIIYIYIYIYTHNFIYITYVLQCSALPRESCFILKEHHDFW